MSTLGGPLSKLESAVRERGAGAYVMSVSADGSPHVVYAPVRWTGQGLAAEIGARTALNARARPMVTLLFPVRTPDDYSLIVDGAADVDRGGAELRLTPVRGVLHRPGRPSDPASSCGADCIPLFTASAGSRPGAS